MFNRFSKFVTLTSGAILVSYLFGVASVHANTDLEKAFLKEFAFLENQKRELINRIAEIKETSAKDVTSTEREISKLESKQLDTENQVERLNDLLTEIEHQVEKSSDDLALLESTYEQANATVSEHTRFVAPLALDEKSSHEQKIAQLFQKAAELKKAVSTIHSAEGEFFLTDGRKVAGDIVYVGNIASYGVSSEGAGMLAPAGAGQLKLWPEDANQVALDIAAGKLPEQLDIFLYESLKTSIEEQQKGGVIDTINSGGAIAWIIVLLGFIALGAILLRMKFLHQANANNEKLYSDVGNLVSQGKVDDALKVCEAESGSTARVVAATLRNIERDREHVEDIISESILHESGALNRFGNIIIVIAAVSPLLGLLGTVTGMISTFDVITEFGTGDPKLLSGGISVALVTTQIGLVVAIPVLIVGNLLSGWSNRIKDEMEKAALRVTNLYGAHKAVALRKAA